MELRGPWTAASPSAEGAVAVADAAAAAPTPPPPCEMPSWPCDINSINDTPQHTIITSATPITSEPFIALAHLALARQKYLDSLVPPSSEQIIRIAGLQAIKEAQNKRRDRIHRRIASEASLQRYRHDAFQNLGALGGIGDVSITSHHAGVIRSHSPSTTATKARSSSIIGNDNTEKTGRPYNIQIAPIIQQHLYHNHSHHGHRQHQDVGVPQEQNQQKPIDASARWTQAIREIRFRALTAPRSRTGLTADIAQALPPAFVFNDDGTGRSLSGLPRPLTARQRWKKAVSIACHAGFDSPALAAASGERDQTDGDYQSELEYMSSVSSSASDSESDLNDDKERAKAKKIKKKRDAAAAKAKCKEQAKVIDELYLLELVDVKHRYGLNLFVYHQAWRKSPTMENFFYWLDYGEGRFLDLGEDDGCCSREKLDRELIRYLSPEQQRLYLVVVGSGGRLCWAKNGLPVDTDSEKWRDSVDGIVAVDDNAPVYTSPFLLPEQPGTGSLANVTCSPLSPPCSSASNSRTGWSWSADHTYAPSLSPASGCLRGGDKERTGTTASDNSLTPKNKPLTGNERGQQQETKEPTNNGSGKNSRDRSDSKAMHKLKYGNSPASWLIDKFLRRQWGEKPWIFVADSASCLYIGIKDSGSFQHTSFVRGSRVSAAGMISVRGGKITGLSPLSGHYRPPTRNFRAFVGRLKDMGVDLSSSSSPSPSSSPSSFASRDRGDGSRSDGGRRRGRVVGGEMRLCYGQDYWLLRGFEIYSGIRRVFGSESISGDDHGRKADQDERSTEVARKQGDVGTRNGTETDTAFSRASRRRRKSSFLGSGAESCFKDEKGGLARDAYIEDMGVISTSTNAGPAEATQKMSLGKWWRDRSVSMPYLRRNV